MQRTDNPFQNTFTSLIVALAMIACTAVVTNAQQVTELVLEASHSEGFGFMSGVRELSDGRIVVADPLGQVLVALDLETGRADTIGRVGSGPQEYKQPDAVFPLPSDSILLLDLGNARLIAVGPDGGFGSSIPIMRSRPDGRPTTLMPRFLDAHGRIYFRLSAYTPGQMPDSAFVARYDRATEIVDTLGTLRIPKAESERVGNNMVMTRGPLMPMDDWAVALDGTVAIVRAADYSIEWILPDGSVERGSPTPYGAVDITRAERERWADEAYANQLTMSSAMSRDGSVSRSQFRRGGGTRPELEPIEWPDALPPFKPDRSHISPFGDLWVERYQEVGATPVVDVFDRQGNKNCEVVLPLGRRVIGFGDGVVYLARTDEFDLQWLERYRIVRD